MPKRLCYILFFTITLVSCNQRQTNDMEKVVDEKNEKDSGQSFQHVNGSNEKFEDVFNTTIDSTYPCQLATPDTSVYGVILQDRKSSIKQLGEKFETLEDNIDMPHMTFSSQDKSQTLTAFFHYGGYRNEYSEFQVKEFSSKDKATILPTNSFVTNSGIKLGLPKEKVIAILGKCFKAVDSSNKTELIKYRIDDFPNSGFLHRFNMPSYYAEYEFRHNSLIRFRFGFEYP